MRISRQTVLVIGVFVACAASAVVAADKDAPASKSTDRKAAEKKRVENAEEIYNHYLELARVTAADPAAPRWMDNLMLDPRARALNDLLTVRVVESVNATGSADASVSKNSSGSASLTNFFGLESKLPSIIDPANLVNTASDTKFKGGGTTTRTGQLTTNLTVRVSEVLPNGDLVLEGARELQINGDRQLIVLTGVVRPFDVGPGNVVLSTAIGQLRVQYVGNGLIKDSLNPGFLVRLLNKVF